MNVSVCVIGMVDMEWVLHRRWRRFDSVVIILRLILFECQKKRKFDFLPYISHMQALEGESIRDLSALMNKL